MPGVEPKAVIHGQWIEPHTIHLICDANECSFTVAGHGLNFECAEDNAKIEWKKPLLEIFKAAQKCEADGREMNRWGFPTTAIRSFKEAEDKYRAAGEEQEARRMAQIWSKIRD